MFRKDKKLENKNRHVRNGIVRSTRDSEIIKGIFVVFGIIIFIVISTGSANAYERPEYSDGLESAWHPGKICLPCHYTLAGTERAKAISDSCDNCHIYRKADSISTKKIDMSKIQNIHENMVCIRCHVGSKSQTNITAADFHRVMSKTACLSCHTFDNGAYRKPSKTQCSDCHGKSPHVAHGKKIEKMCVACHGESMEKFIGTVPVEGGNMISIPGQNTSASQINEYPSIGQFIIELLEQFSKILR